MTCLIDDGMKAAQGPALWTFNNAVFSDDDLKNIVKLSGATKEKQTSKIGRFGLGFNAVYNITDVPSFITRQFIAIFDPHTKHLGRAIIDKTKPGIKLDLQKNSRKIKKLSNQFKPFQGVFGCDTVSKNHYNGTLFRFPLRTKEQSRASEISNKHYSHEEFIKLLTLLAQSAEFLLLFTQNILKVTVYHLGRDARDGSEAKPLFTITRKLLETIRQISPIPMLSEIATQSQDFEQRLLHQTNILNATSAYGKSSAMQIQSSIIMEVQVESTWSAQNLSVVEKTGKRSYQWAISNSSGTDSALQQATKDPSKLVAVGGVAIPVQLQGSHLSVQPASEGTTFCFLPLPITTPGLPVNINGYFSVHSSRRFLDEAKSDDIDNKKGLWNEALAADPICNAYLNLLLDMTTRISPSEFSLLKMLPTMKLDQAQPVPQKLTQRLLQSIIRSPVKLFSDGERYAFFSQILYLQPEFRACEVGKLAHKVFCQLSQCVIIDMPEELINLFQEGIVGCRQEIQDKMYDKKRFYSEIFLPCIRDIDVNERNELICHALSDSSLDSILKDVACIPVTPHGELKKASELIHPESKAAKLYGEEDSRFPMLPRTVLTALERLGMRKEIPWEDVLERANSVTSLDKTEAVKRCKALVEYMQYKLRNRYEQQECPNSTRDRIRATPFLPPMEQPSHITLPWKESLTALLSPQDVYLEDKKMLLCAVCPLVEKTIVSSEYQHTEVATFLGLKRKNVTSEQLIDQLRAIKTAVEDNSEACKPSRSDMETCIKAVYEELQRTCLTDEFARLNIATIFQKERLLYFDGGFRSVNRCAFDALGSCEPHLFIVPRSDAYRFRQFFSSIGVKEKFTWIDYMEALQRMKEDSRSEPLNKDDLQKSVNLLTYICRSVEWENVDVQEEKLQEKVFIPDTNGVLQKCSEMSFNNCPWIKTSDELKLTHSLVAHQFAKTLNMKTIREDLLDKCSDDFGDDFSQKEKLTNRLRRILEGYPRDVTVLKELLQNADDAGATEIHFILDTRHHGTEKVFEDKWKPLQGPALCVYNNKPFTNADLAGIQNLGEGSKGKDPNKTGQYGIGFNCVYNITDAPMFITKGEEVGETLCIFDPQCQYIPTRPYSMSTGKQLPRKPARDLNSLRKQFPDVFTSLLDTLVDIDNSTLFRFPLRKYRSSLGDTVSLRDIDKLFKEFEQELPECLLFLANLKQVKLSIIDTSGRLKEIYTVLSKLSNDDDMESHVQFTQHVRSTGRKLKMGQATVSGVDSRHILYSMEIEDSTGVCKKYRVAQQIGVYPGYKVPESVLDAYRDGNLALLPRGGIAYLTEHTSKKLPKKDCKSRICCFLPLPLDPKLPEGIHINGHFALDYESRRALWQPDIPSYKSHWNTCIMEGVLAPLYVHLLSDQKPKHQDFKQKGELNEKQTKYSLRKYSKLFPDYGVRKDGHLYLDTFHDAVYGILAEKEVEVFPVLRPDNPIPEWHSVKHSYFNDLSSYNSLRKKASLFGLFGASLAANDDKSPPPYELVEEVLLKAGFNLLWSPLRIMSSFKIAHENSESAAKKRTMCEEVSQPCVKGVTPKDVIEFFKTCHLKIELPKHLSQTCMTSFDHLEWLMKFCQDYEGFTKELCGLPFLVTVDGFLTVISNKSPVFLTWYTGLISNKPKRFVHPNLVSYFKSLKVLENPASGFQALKTKDLAEMFIDDPECDRLLHGEISYRQDDAHKEWLLALWQYLSEEADRELAGRLRARDYCKADQQKLDSLLMPLSDWSIFPVRHHATTYLRPLRKATSAVDLKYGNISENAIFVKLQLPIPDYSVLCRSLSDLSVALAERLVASPAHAYRIILCLEDYMSSYAMVTLKTDEAESLLQYFARNMDTLKQVANHAREVLQRLPYFETVFNDLISIAGTHAYIIPSSIPTEDMDVWKRSRSGNVFLKSNATLTDLFVYLGCIEKTEVEVYCEFILEQQHFDLMTNKGRMVHLQYIKNILLPDLTYYEIQHRNAKVYNAKYYKAAMEKSALIEKLKGLEFIPDKEGNLHKASRYFHPDEEVFKAMQCKEDFPPKPFCTKEWLPFLETAGLICSITQDMFVDYAKQIEGNAARDGGCQELEAQSETLVRHLWSREDLYANFLNQVKEIAFVAPKRADKVLCSLYPQHATKSMGSTNEVPFAKFKGSIIDEGDNMKLAWSTAVMIPCWARPYSYYLSANDMIKTVMRNLEIVLNPTLDMIVSNIEHVCDRQTKLQGVRKETDCTIGGCLIDVIVTVFRHLEKNLGELSDAHIVRLQNLNCIPVENGAVLVRPKQVVLELLSDDEIPPYFYKVPSVIEQFASLCKKLEISKLATKAHYCDVLQRLHREVGDEKMNPNELYSSLKAFRGLIDLFNRTLPQVGEDRKGAELEQLYLPTKDHQLVLSNKTILIDDVLLHNRVSQLKDVNYIIGAEHFTGRAVEFKDFYKQSVSKAMLRRFIKALPIEQQPKFLSHVLEEELEESHDEISASTEMAKQISEMLQTPEFQEGLLRLIRQKVNQEDEENELEEEEREHKETCNNLAKLTIEGRQEIKTYMCYHGNRIPESERSKEIYHKFEKDTDGNVVKCTLFVINKTMKDFDDFWEELANFIDQVTGDRIGRNVTYLQKMFTMSISRISAFLDSKGICRLNRSVGSCPLPRPGDPIPIDDHHLLVQDFHSFRKGEYVGKFLMFLGVT